MSALLERDTLVPHVVHDLSNEAYHSSPGISKSGLDDLAQSPYHYWSRRFATDRPKTEETAAQRLGTMVHCAVLEPERFAQDYIVGPDCRRGTKEWAAFTADYPSAEIIKATEARQVQSMAESIRSIGGVRDALLSGEAESSAFWHDQDSGVLCRCRPDMALFTESGWYLFDLKTVGSAHPAEFKRQATRLRYHVQDAFYSEGYAAATGHPVAGFVFLAVETAYPYAASACQIDADQRVRAKEIVRRDLDVYAECLKIDTWPAYGDQIHTISLPKWAFCSTQALPEEY